MLVKRGFIFLIFLLLVNISYAQDSNQCLLVNENNVGEAAERIWNTFSSLGLENALSAVDSLQPGDNGYEFREEIKEELRKKAETEEITLEDTIAQQIIDDAFAGLYTAEVSTDETGLISDIISNPFSVLAEKITVSIDKIYPGLSEPLTQTLAILMLKNNGEIDTRGFEINKIIPEIVKKMNPESYRFELEDDIFALSMMNYLFFYGKDIFLLYGELVTLSGHRDGNELSEREREIKERIARTVNPFGYDNLYSFDRVEDYLLDRSKYDKETVNTLNINTKVRIDTFRKYLGQIGRASCRVRV